MTFVVFESTYVAIRGYGAERMGAEDGPIEMAQVGLALIAAVGLFCAARWTVIGRAGLVICGALVTYAAARESDRVFETLLFDDAYKWLVGLPMVMLAAVAVFVDRRRLIGDLMWLMRHPAATLFVIAGVYLCSVCQALDRPGLWVGISNAGESAATKAMIEEYAELFAYLLLAFSGIEASIFAYRGRAMDRDAESDSQDFPRIAA